MFLDLSAAYNYVNQHKLVIKVTDLVRKSGRQNFFGVIVGFCLRWLGLDGRRVVSFAEQSVRTVRGLPQGSPLSCAAFVCYFDFDLDDSLRASGIILIFADDSTVHVKAASWPAVDRIVDLIFQDFDQWCSQNDQVLNVQKSSVSYLKRKQPPLNTPFLVEPIAKSLGIYIDSSFNFNHHVDHICTWAKKRVCLLRLLRGKLKFSYKVLSQIVVCWRSKFHFGSFWILNLSATAFKKLCSAYAGLQKAAFGLVRTLSPEKTASFTGMWSLAHFLKYWFSLQHYQADLKDIDGIFQKFNQIQVEAQTGQTNVRRSKRSSTVASSSTTFAACIRRSSGFPEPVMAWFEKCKSPYKFLRDLQIPCNYKLRLKKKLGFRHEVYRIFDDDTIRISVKEMNEQHIKNHS